MTVTPKDPVERGLHFATRMGAEAQEDITALATDLYALLDALLDRGALTWEQFANARTESERRFARRRRLRVVFGDDDEKLAGIPQPDIDCPSLIPICKARCCRLRFALSRQDLDRGVVRWDYEEPYLIAQNREGWCAHIDMGSTGHATMGCTVYEHRPMTCRLFDCREDGRIWLDFERRIPAPEGEPNVIAVPPEGV